MNRTTAPRATVKSSAKTSTTPSKTTRKAAAPARAASSAKTKGTTARPASAAAQAKRSAVAKAKAIAPEVAAPIGSTPATSYRGDPHIFGRLVQDHDRHRALLAMITQTKPHDSARATLFLELTRELKSHAAAEEQALWSSVMRNPATTDDARHAVSEHKEIDDMLADLAARDMTHSGWLRRFAALHEEYLHHIREEEQEQFVAAEKRLSSADIRYMKQVFNQRKKAEKAQVVVEKKIKLK